MKRSKSNVSMEDESRDDVDIDDQYHDQLSDDLMDDRPESEDYYYEEADYERRVNRVKKSR